MKRSMGEIFKPEFLDSGIGYILIPQGYISAVRPIRTLTQVFKMSITSPKYSISCMEL